MEIDFEKVLEAAKWSELRPCKYDTESDEYFEELIKKHIEHIEAEWKSPITIPKQIDGRDCSTLVLVRIAGIDDIGFARYNFDKNCWDVDHTSTVIGWNYMTRGFVKLVKNYFLRYRDLELKDPEQWYFKIWKFCKNVGLAYDITGYE